MNQLSVVWMSCVVWIAVAGLPAQEPYGAGAPGTGSVYPTLTCSQAWLGNASYALNIGSGLGGATAWLGISLLPASIPVGTFQLLIDPSPANLFILLPIPLSGPSGVAGAGAGTLPIPLTFPWTPTLAGTLFYAQALIDEGPGGTIAATRGLKIELVLPPTVFVGTSVGGSADPSWFIDPLSQTITSQFTSNADNVTDAEFAHGGRRLYVGTSLGASIREVDLDGSPPVWSTFFAAGMSCYGIGVDQTRRLVYTLTSASSFAELVAVDAALGSPTYGQQLATTTGLGSFGFVERWSLSHDGNRAAVLTVFSPMLLIVDTNPNSPTYMQVTPIGPVPSGPAALAIATSCVFTRDNQEILVSIQLAGSSPGEVARYHFGAGAWLDHNAGQGGIQNIGPSSAPPAIVPSAAWTISMSHGGTFAIISGWNLGGGVGRVDLDLNNPFLWSYTSFNPGVSLAGAWSSDISGDDTRVAVGTFGAGPSSVRFLDALTGADQGAVVIGGASNVYTVKYH